MRSVFVMDVQGQNARQRGRLAMKRNEREKAKTPSLTRPRIRRRGGLYYTRLKIPNLDAVVEFALHGIRSRRQAVAASALLHAQFAVWGTVPLAIQAC